MGGRESRCFFEGVDTKDKVLCSMYVLLCVYGCVLCFYWVLVIVIVIVVAVADDVNRDER